MATTSAATLLLLGGAGRSAPLPLDLIEAIQGRLRRVGPDRLKPRHNAQGKPIAGDYWRGVIIAGVAPPYAQIVEISTISYRVPGVTSYGEQILFRISLYAGTPGLVRQLVQVIRPILDGTVLRFQDGRMIHPVRLETRGSPTDLRGVGAGGLNLWRLDDIYRAWVLRDDL